MFLEDVATNEEASKVREKRDNYLQARSGNVVSSTENINCARSRVMSAFNDECLCLMCACLTASRTLMAREARA